MNKLCGPRRSTELILANKYGNCSVDDFVNKIVGSGVEAVGLTNYFRFDNEELGTIKKKLAAFMLYRLILRSYSGYKFFTRSK